MTSEPFRYRCPHGVGLDEECICCSFQTIGSYYKNKRAEDNLALSPTYRDAISRAAKGPRARPNHEIDHDSGIGV